MFRDDTFVPSSPHTSRSRSPSPPAHQNDTLDDIFGSAPPSPTFSLNLSSGLSASSAFTPSRTEPSDIPRLRSLHSTAGYRDGLTAAKATTIQEGFDEGCSLGATMGMRLGGVVGALEGVFAALAKSGNTAGRKGAIAEVAAGGVELRKDSEVDGEEKRVKALLESARRELVTEEVFGRAYWGLDGVWTYEVKETGNGWKDIVDAHPLVRKWEAIVTEEVGRRNLDMTVMERLEVRRDGEEEAVERS